MKNHYTNNSCKRPSLRQFYDIFVVINQMNKHKAKIYNQCMYTHNYYKNFIAIMNIFLHLTNIKKKILFVKYKNDKFIVQWIKAQPSEFGKKPSKKMPSYMKIVTAKYKLRWRKCGVMYYAYEGKTWLSYWQN